MDWPLIDHQAVIAAIAGVTGIIYTFWKLRQEKRRQHRIRERFEEERNAAHQQVNEISESSAILARPPISVLPVPGKTYSAMEPTRAGKAHEGDAAPPPRAPEMPAFEVLDGDIRASLAGVVRPDATLPDRSRDMALIFDAGFKRLEDRFVSESRRSFWWGLAQNAFFLVLGAFLPTIIGMLVG